jgi:hypothetical protein
MKTKLIVPILVLSGCIFSPWSTFAGGPGLLKLPVEGLTSQNQQQCEQLLQSKLKEQLVQENNWKYGYALVGENDGTHILVNPGSSTVSLAEIEKALEGSPYRIDRNQLLFRGVVRIEASKQLDAKALRTALSDGGTGVNVTERTLKDGSHSFVVNTLKREGAPLLSYRDLMAVVKKQHAELHSISWGVDKSQKESEEMGTWMCRAPFGASRVSEATKSKLVLP